MCDYRSGNYCAYYGMFINRSDYCDTCPVPKMHAKK
jgi:hypothetical protein